MILYGSTISPYVRKVAVFAAEKNIPLEIKGTGRGGDDPDFRSASPLAKMPALRDGDFTVADSTAIIFYLDGVGSGPELIPSDPKQRAWTIWWDEFADTELFECVRPMFFNRLVLPLFRGEPGDEAAAQAAEPKIGRFLDQVEKALPEGGWLVGDRMTLADIAVASALTNLSYLEMDLPHRPRTAAWLETMHARPSFAMVADEKALIAKRRAA